MPSTVYLLFSTSLLRSMSQDTLLFSISITRFSPICVCMCVCRQSRNNNHEASRIRWHDGAYTYATAIHFNARIHQPNSVCVYRTLNLILYSECMHDGAKVHGPCLRIMLRRWRMNLHFLSFPSIYLSIYLSVFVCLGRWRRSFWIFYSRIFLPHFFSTIWLRSVRKRWKEWKKSVKSYFRKRTTDGERERERVSGKRKMATIRGRKKKICVDPGSHSTHCGAKRKSMKNDTDTMHRDHTIFGEWLCRRKRARSSSIRVSVGVCSSWNNKIWINFYRLSLYCNIVYAWSWIHWHDARSSRPRYSRIHNISTASRHSPQYTNRIDRFTLSVHYFRLFGFAEVACCVWLGGCVRRNASLDFVW